VLTPSRIQRRTQETDTGRSPRKGGTRRAAWDRDRRVSRVREGVEVSMVRDSVPVGRTRQTSGRVHSLKMAETRREGRGQVAGETKGAWRPRPPGKRVAAIVRPAAGRQPRRAMTSAALFTSISA